MKELYNWFYEKYLDWQLKRVYPNGVSEEEYQRARLLLARRKPDPDSRPEQFVDDLINTKKMKEAIQKAIEGGYQRPLFMNKLDFALTMVPAKNRKDRDTQKFLESIILLDPLFWQALGKSLGWENVCCSRCGRRPLKVPGGDEYFFEPGYVYHWHRFIDHLAEGGDPEKFFVDLLAKTKE